MPRSGPRVRVPSRADKIKRLSQWIVALFYQHEMFWNPHNFIMRVPEKVHRTFSHLALIEIETFLFHEFASTCLYSKYWVFRHFRLEYPLIIHSLLSCFFANWAIGYCKDYNIDTSVQMEKSISILMDKKEELKQIREKNDAEFYLQVVPTLCVDESTPALAPSMTVMDFCYETRTQIDIDLYLED